MRRWRHPTSRDLCVVAHPGPASLVDIVPKSIETPLLSDITGYHPNYFLPGFRATPSMPTSIFQVPPLQRLPRATLKAATLRAAIFAGWPRPPLPRNSPQPGVLGKLDGLVFKGAYWQGDCQSEEEKPCVVLVPSGMGGSVGYTDRLDLSCL